MSSTFPTGNENTIFCNHNAHALFHILTAPFVLFIVIRAVVGQRSSPESGFANTTKMFFRAKHKRRKITGL